MCSCETNQSLKLYISALNDIIFNKYFQFLFVYVGLLYVLEE